MFDSRCLAASLGYLIGETPCYQQHRDDYKYYLQGERKGKEEKKKALYKELQLTLSFISEQQLGKILFIVSVYVKAEIWIVTQGWLHDRSSYTDALCDHDPTYSGLKSKGSINFQKSAGDAGNQLSLL